MPPVQFKGAENYASNVNFLNDEIVSTTDDFMERIDALEKEIESAPAVKRERVAETNVSFATRYSEDYRNKVNRHLYSEQRAFDEIRRVNGYDKIEPEEAIKLDKFTDPIRLQQQKVVFEQRDRLLKRYNEFIKKYGK